MMSKMDNQFEEDRAMRDAARKVLLADIEHAKTALSAKGLANRVGGRVGDGAKDVFEIAKIHAQDNRGILAIVTGALILWFAKAPLLEILGFGSSARNAAEDTNNQTNEAVERDINDSNAEYLDSQQSFENIDDAPAMVSKHE